MSIKVTNTSPKVIGIGNMHVVQGQTITLPAGFGVDHPTIKYLINRGWLTKVSAGGVMVPPSTNESESVQTQTPAADAANSGGAQTPDDDDMGNPAENTGEETDDGDSSDNAVDENPTRRQIKRMNSEQLRNLATQRGIAFESNATNAVLVDLILAAMPDADNGGQE